jgi:hypothetical protein
MAGIGEGRLRGADLARPHHGIRSPVDGTSLLDRCRDYAPLLRPGQFFSHLTAARLWDLPLPRELDGREPLHVSTLAPARAPRGGGIAGHQARNARAVTRHDFPVSDPASTWFALAPLLRLDDLVAVGDALVLDPVVLDPRNLRPHTTVGQLRRELSRFSGRGARAAASALPLVREGAESRPETLLRLLIVRAGLPEPEVNVSVTDGAGKVLGRGDLVYPRWRTVVEYDGEHHRTDSRQYDKDITRIEDFVHAEWRVVRVRKHGLFVTPHATLERIERALRSAGWRP